MTRIFDRQRENTSIKSRPSFSLIFRLGRYFTTRLTTVILAIFVGVYITIVVANRSGAIDMLVERDILADLQIIFPPSGDYSLEDFNQKKEALREEAGLNLPKPVRNLHWTYNALTFQWGTVNPIVGGQPTRLVAHIGSMRTRYRVTNIIGEYLPNSLLLICTAHLAVLVIGIPLSLHLSRRPGKWLDRLIAALSPTASIPGWVHGIILVMIFSVGLRILPTGGMYDAPPAETNWEYSLMIMKHMVLPVTAILLGLFLQYVYVWRTFFLIYASEDYVELAVAKGLPSRQVERKYIMRPTLPFVITSFTLTLVGFWQMTTALEYFFRWPGIGFLYVESLNTFDVIIAVGIVVVFAYLLSVVVVLLDVAYAIVDPRIRLLKSNEQSGSVRKRKIKRMGKAEKPAILTKERFHRSRNVCQENRSYQLKSQISQILQGFGRITSRSISLLRELVHYPSAVIGLMIILLLVGLSICAPFVSKRIQQQDSWSQEELIRPVVPISAAPLWVNLFRRDDLPQSMVINSRNGSVQKITDPYVGTGEHLTITFEFNYPYGEIPQDVSLYFDTSYDEIHPFVFVTWIYPDGSEVAFNGTSISNDTVFNLSERFPRRYGISHHLHHSLGSSSLFPLYVLFSDPDKEHMITMQGKYTLQLDILTFEDGSEVDAELILIGQAYGVAGTDSQRQDLLIPLLWGAPAALLIGLIGAILTTLVSILVAAAGTWFGGWVDNLTQRLTEVVMILPLLAIGILLMRLFGLSLWVILSLIIALTALGSPVKTYRAALLQVKEAAYIEAAQAYGASNWRIVLHYMLPRIIPVLIPQLVILVPSYVFLEATLAIFGVSRGLPTWGNLIYTGLKTGVLLHGNYTWFLQPVILLVLTGLGFALVGAALDRVLNPRLKDI